LDPARDPSLKSEILAKLGLPPSSRVEALSGNCGGRNQGVWTIQDSSSHTKLILKLVRSQGQIGGSEAEKLRQLAGRYPLIVNDHAVAFPLKIFSCLEPSGSKSHDFIVMKKVAGEPVGDVIGMKWNCGRKAEVMNILRDLGAFLAQFHKRYANSQHCDFQPSNVFYDAASGKFALIDIADIGNQSCREGDVKHFVSSLGLLAVAYGDQFYSEGKRHFEEGYRACA
jgi:serine/threonine protein kinase